MQNFTDLNLLLRIKQKSIETCNTWDYLSVTHAGQLLARTFAGNKEKKKISD